MHSPLAHQGMYSPHAHASLTRWVKSPCPACGSLLLVERHTQWWRHLLHGNKTRCLPPVPPSILAKVSARLALKIQHPTENSAANATLPYPFPDFPTLPLLTLYACSVLSGTAGAWGHARCAMRPGAWGNRTGVARYAW